MVCEGVPCWLGDADSDRDTEADLESVAERLAVWDDDSDRDDVRSCDAVGVAAIEGLPERLCEGEFVAVADSLVDCDDDGVADAFGDRLWLRVPVAEAERERE